MYGIVGIFIGLVKRHRTVDRVGEEIVLVKYLVSGARVGMSDYLENLHLLNPNVVCIFAGFFVCVCVCVVLVFYFCFLFCFTK